MAGIDPAPAALIVTPAGISPANGKTIPARAAPGLHGAGMDPAPEKLRPARAGVDLHLAGTGAAPAGNHPAPGTLRVSCVGTDFHLAGIDSPAAGDAAPLARTAPAMTGKVPSCMHRQRAIHPRRAHLFTVVESVEGRLALTPALSPGRGRNGCRLDVVRSRRSKVRPRITNRPDAALLISLSLGERAGVRAVPLSPTNHGVKMRPSPTLHHLNN